MESGKNDVKDDVVDESPQLNKVLKKLKTIEKKNEELKKKNDSLTKENKELKNKIDDITKNDIVKFIFYQIQLTVYLLTILLIQ